MTAEAEAAPAPIDWPDRLAGTLLGTALGDALGLPMEGLKAASIAWRFGAVDRFHLLGRTGFVSDDTEQSALMAQSLARHPDDAAACTRAFRRALLGWFLRLPWGIGFGTLRACLKIAIGISPSGVNSAGNGAAMRAAVVGAFFRDDAAARRTFGTALAEVTHRDPRAVEGALFVAELAAACAGDAAAVPDACFKAARHVVANAELGAALDRARELALAEAATATAADALRTTGFVICSVPFAAFCFLRYGTDPFTAITECVEAGGDTDTNAAMVGAWVGALHGATALPAHLVERIHDGPFGPTHLRALADNLATAGAGRPYTVVRYSAVVALARNLALYPVILLHGLRRLLPF